MSRKQQFILIFILGVLATISPFSIDMYLPGFPAIAEDLRTTIASVQLSLTSYFVGIAVGQLIYGPLLDRYGRKTPLYTGLIIYIFASAGCAVTGSVESLIAMRFLQAIGGCAGMVAAQAFVRDLIPAEKTAQAFSSMMLVVAVSPMIAPTIGGYMTTAFGWHSMFLVLAFITLVVLIAVHFVLPDGKKADPTISLKPGAVLSNFRTVIRQPQFSLYTLSGGLASAATFAYIAGSSYIFIELYHTSEQEYGWIFAIIAFVLIGTTQLNHILLRKYKSENIITFSFIKQTIIGSLLISGTYFGWFDQTMFIVLTAAFLAGHGLINPNASALSLAPFSKHAGSAASLTGSFRLAMGGLASALVSIFHDGTAMPMVALMVGFSLFGFLLLLIGKAIVLHRASKQTHAEEASALI